LTPLRTIFIIEAGEVVVAEEDPEELAAEDREEVAEARPSLQAKAQKKHTYLFKCECNGQ
jgi:hypothetical protein